MRGRQRVEVSTSGWAVVWRFVAVLTLVGMLQAEAWSPADRAQTAAGIAHAICSGPRPPSECSPSGKPSDFIGGLIRWLG